MARATPNQDKISIGIEQIEVLISEMSEDILSAITAAADALTKNDNILASRIVAGTAKIDRISEAIERRCVQLIALNAPAPDALQRILTLFKIGMIIEKLGDCARRIAEQTPRAGRVRRLSTPGLLHEIIDTATTMVRAALYPFIASDVLDMQAMRRDNDDLESLHDELLKDLLDLMADNTRNIGPFTSLILVSHHFERMGDYAITVAKLADDLSKDKGVASRFSR